MPPVAKREIRSGVHTAGIEERRSEKIGRGRKGRTPGKLGELGKKVPATKRLTGSKEFDG